MKTTEITVLGKQILTDLPGFTLKGQMLFMRPLGHTLRGIFLDRSNNPRGFYVQVFIQPLFVPAENIIFNVGWRLGGGSHIWNADIPNLLSELGAAVKREALPFLSRVRLPQDAASAAASLQKSGDPYVQQAIAYAFARSGDVQQSLIALAQLERMLDLKEQYGWQLEMKQRSEALRMELQDSPLAVQSRLGSWEAETAKKLGLEKFR